VEQRVGLLISLQRNRLHVGLLINRERLLPLAEHLTSLQKNRLHVVVHVVPGTNNCPIVHKIPGGNHLPGII
jgi:hypothetical protein